MLGSAVVAMVQPTQASPRDDLTRACRTSPARRCLLLKPEVRSVVMIIGHVFKEESLQMVLVQSNDVVEHIPSAAADPALSNTVLPRAPDGSLRGDDLHGSNRGWNFQSILCIVIKDEELGGRLIREGFSQLLGNPGASGKTRNVEVENAPAVMPDDEEAVQKAESDGGYGKEVHGGDGFAMVAKK